MEQIQKLWTGILDVMSKLVIPDWGGLIALLPVFLLVGVLLWVLMTVRAYAVLGPRERGRRYIAVPPAGLHAPGPSFAPVFGAVGAALFVFGIVLGGLALLLAVGGLIASAVYSLLPYRLMTAYVRGDPGESLFLGLLPLLLAGAFVMAGKLFAGPTRFRWLMEANRKPYRDPLASTAEGLDATRRRKRPRA